MIQYQANRKQNFEDLKNVGDYMIGAGEKAMLAILPGTTFPMSINLDPDSPRPRWTLTWNDGKPTLRPSLVIPEWHGWLTDGVFQTC